LTLQEQNSNICSARSTEGLLSMSQNSAPDPPPDADHLDTVADQAIAAHGGDIRNALKATIAKAEDLEAEVKYLRAAVTIVYTSGFTEHVPPDRVDWYH
jgi:hypothetical protein